MSGYDYGENYFSRGPYGGGPFPPFLGIIPVIVELYDNNLARKSTFQTGSGDFAGCGFTLNESGCQNFSLQFTTFQDIEERDIVKIKLFYSLDVFFMGVVRKTPIQGSSFTDYIYSGYGLIDYLYRVNCQTQTYANKTIEYIINDLLDNIITPSTPITKNLDKLDFPDVTLTSLTINYAQIPEALETLKKIANSEGEYIVGVDSMGEFFFLPRNTDTKVTLMVGNHGDYGIPFYIPEDSDEPVSKIYLLDKDGGYIDTISSTEEVDINELKLTAPDIDNTSAVKWAEGILAQREITTRRATIEWRIEKVNPIFLAADGNIRIISTIPPVSVVQPEPNPFGSGTFGSGLFGGGQYTGYNIDDTLKVKQVSYFINSTQAIRQIELGSLPVTLDRQIIEVQKQLNELIVSLGV